VSHNSFVWVWYDLFRFQHQPLSKERALHRTLHVSHDSFRISVTCLIHMCEYSCDMTHSYVCDMTYSYSPWSKERTLHRTWHESHNSFRISVTYFIHVWDLARHVTLNESCHMWMRHVTYEHVMSRETSDPRLLVSYKWVMSHMNESCHTHLMTVAASDPLLLANCSPAWSRATPVYIYNMLIYSYKYFMYIYNLWIMYIYIYICIYEHHELQSGMM